MDTNWRISLVRTVVAPLLIGVLVSSLIPFGDGSSSFVGIGRVVTSFAIAVAWYVCARLAQRGHPQLGFLLGISARPRYGEDGESELAPSLRRTLVPLAVATAVASLVAAFIDGRTPALCLVGAALVYYGVLRWIEERPGDHDVAGWLLGARTVLHY